MIERFERSPRGYAYLTEGKLFPRQGSSIAFSSTFAYDPTIESLWQKYLNVVGTNPPVELTLLMLEQLKKKFGEFRDWVWIQASVNRAVHGYALDFIVDTIEFVQTGQREYSIDTWYSLITTDPPLEHIDADPRVALFKNIHIPKTEDLLVNWLKHEKGVHDLFQTAHILFGKTS